MRLHPGGEVKWRQDGFNWKFSSLEIHDVTDADPVGNNPIFSGGDMIGRAAHAAKERAAEKRRQKKMLAEQKKRLEAAHG